MTDETRDEQERWRKVETGGGRWQTWMCSLSWFALRLGHRFAEMLSNRWMGTAPCNRKLSYALFLYWVLGMALVEVAK